MEKGDEKMGKKEIGLLASMEIDKLALDEEWEKQPIKYMKLATESVDAQSIRDGAKSLRETVYAIVEHEVRSEPAKWGLDAKVTEAAIRNAVTLDERVAAAEEEYLQAVHDAKILDVAVQAMDHRKKALEMLTQLFLASYFSRPYIPGAAKEKAMDNVHAEQVRGLERNPRTRRLNTR